MSPKKTPKVAAAAPKYVFSPFFFFVCLSLLIKFFLHRRGRPSKGTLAAKAKTEAAAAAAEAEAAVARQDEW
jgi:hypothetical protein